MQCWWTTDFLLADWHLRRFKRGALIELSAAHEHSPSLLPWFSSAYVGVCNYKGSMIYTHIFLQQMSSLLSFNTVCTYLFHPTSYLKTCNIRLAQGGKNRGRQNIAEIFSYTFEKDIYRFCSQFLALNETEYSIFRALGE